MPNTPSAAARLPPRAALRRKGQEGRKPLTADGDEDALETARLPIVAQHFVGDVATDVEVAIPAKCQASWSIQPAGASIDEGPPEPTPVAVEAHHAVVVETADVEVSIRAKRQLFRATQL